MRIDKFLKVSRILKRRTVAGRRLQSGQSRRQRQERSSRLQLKIGDVVELKFSAGSLKFRVLALKETVKKDEASSLYEIIADADLS